VRRPYRIWLRIDKVGGRSRETNLVYDAGVDKEKGDKTNYRAKNGGESGWQQGKRRNLGKGNGLSRRKETIEKGDL